MRDFFEMACERLSLRNGLIAAAAAALALSIAGCATTGDMATADASGPVTCRDTTLPGQDEVLKVCGTEAQWADFESRVSLVDADVICRERLVPGSNQRRTFCASEEAWKEFERQEAQVAMDQTYRYQGSPYGTFGN
jgi:hypothetical protein